MDQPTPHSQPAQAPEHSLCIGQDGLTRIRTLRLFATHHPVHGREIRAALDSTEAMQAFSVRMREHRIALPPCFVLTFTVELHPDGIFRHLAIAQDTGHTLPVVSVMWIIAAAFGFSSIEPCGIVPENLENGGCAVHLVQALSQPAGHA